MMTGIAVICGVRMVTWFALRNHVVVATCTGANHLGVVNGAGLNRGKRYWPRLMTGIACICRVNMVARLTNCNRAVMTTEAGANHLCVINRVAGHRCPACREHIVAGVTGVGCINM